MKRRSIWIVTAVAVVICGVLWLVAEGYRGRGPLAALGVTVSEHPPVAVRLLGEGADPLVIMIGVRWTTDGYCGGQFTVQATQTQTEVRVGTVTSREYHYGMCPGLGTVDGMAWAHLELTSPLGDRPVVRDSDGTRLPVITPP